MESKLRLLITEECNRDCPSCCNKDWDLKALDVETDFSQYDTIMLTGGEPLLDPNATLSAITYIREEVPKASIFVYTAMTHWVAPLVAILAVADGLTVTLHEQGDVAPFCRFADFLWDHPKLVRGKSLRLNTFKRVYIDLWEIKEIWDVKDNIEWIKDCPLPENEVFKRL